MRTRVLEPKSTFDRVLYVALSLVGPTTASSCFHRDDTFGGVVFSLWTIVTIFYTIEWAILSYRKWRSG